MAIRGQHTLSEIRTQAEAWEAIGPAAMAQAAEWRAFFAGTGPQRGDTGPVLFFGCGSTFYLSLAAAAAWQALTGRAARGVPSSEIIFYPDCWIPADSGVKGVAVSRSGTTTETLQAADALAARFGARLAAITCYPGTPLEKQCTPVLVSPKGQEESIAQTRSFASMLVGCLAVSASAANREDIGNELSALPPVVGRLISDYEPLANELGSDLSIERVFFLGSGPRYGIACEAMLKMKEMSLTASEAYHFMEFRHGPKSMVDDRTLVIGLLSSGAGSAESAVLREVQGLGGRILVLAEDVAGLDWADHRVAFGSGVSEVALLPLYLPVLQLFAYHRSIAKALNPDAPRNLDAVVKL